MLTEQAPTALAPARAVTLVGEIRTLEPLSQAHYDGLVEAAGAGYPWDLPYPSTR